MLLVLLLSMFAQGQELSADGEQMIGLRTGEVLWVEVLSHDEDGVDLLRLDNSGRVRLPWHLLDPRFEAELRAQFGYLDLATEEVLVTADMIRTVDGEEIIGLIVHRTEDAIHIKTAQRLIALPKLRVSGPGVLVRAPALDIYTREELYQKEIFERRGALGLEGASGSEAHFALAQYCERIYDYANAARHYELAGASDSSWRPKDLESALSRARRKAEAQGQIDLLREIRRERQRGHYEGAETLVAAFRVEFPNSPLLQELNQLSASIGRAREDDLVEAVVKRWHAWAGRLTKEAGRKTDYSEAIAWVESELSKAIVSGVQGELIELDPDIAPGRVRAIWEARKKPRSHHASYGFATWLLGDGRARAGMESDEDKPKADSRDQARQDLENRIQRFLERQKTVARASGGRSEEDPAAYWKQMNSSSRAQWLLAYYAEFSGDVEVLDIHFRACRDCGGTGVQEINYFGPVTSGEKRARTRLASCPTCHHVGIVRRVSYR